MTAFAYRLRLGDRPAKPEELESVEEIEVEQEMDMAWEATIRMGLCLDDQGRWNRRPRELAAPFDRVRVEIGVDGRFTPLIDGPVARYDTAMDSRPGRSSLTLVVRDDSTLLNRDEEVEVFEERPDHEVAREVFGRFPFIGETRVETTEGPRQAAVRRGTPIQFLRELARAHGWHAYVLPGPQPGRSVGCFLPDPTGPGDLPPLTLLGPEGNLVGVEVQEDAESPERTRGHTLRISDQRVLDAETSNRDLQLLRDLPPLSDDGQVRRLVPPEEADREDPEVRARARTARARWAYRISGRVAPGCYAGVLAPYQRVTVHAADTPLSGAWLLSRVTHRITPGVYAQSFEALADSRSDPAAPPSVGASGGLSVEVSASFSLF